MTHAQAAAFIQAQTVLAQIELQGMVAQNAHNEGINHLPAFKQADFEELRDKWEHVLGYNAVTLLYHNCYDY